MHFVSRLDAKFWQSPWSMKCRSRAPGQGTWLSSVPRTITLQGFLTPSYQCCREMYIISRLDIDFDKVSGAWNVGQGNQLMMCAWRLCQGQLLCKLSYPQATNVAEKRTLFLDSTQNFDKVSGAWNEGQGHRVKVPAWRLCQGQLTMQGFIFTATTAAEKWTLFLDST